MSFRSAELAKSNIDLGCALSFFRLQSTLSHNNFASICVIFTYTCADAGLEFDGGTAAICRRALARGRNAL